MTDVEFDIIRNATQPMIGWLFALEDGSWTVKFAQDDQGIGISFVHPADAMMFRLMFNL